MIEQSDFFLDYDAAYVMGALDPHDRRAFEEHLTTCARCSAAVAELAGMPGLLAQVPVQQMLAPRATPEPVPDTLLPRLAAVIRAQQRRRRVWTGVLGAAAACLIAGVVLTTSPWSGSGSEPRGAVVAMQADRAVPVSATVGLESADYGTRINVECTYKDGTSPPGGDWTYTLEVVPNDGGPAQTVAQWTALPGKTITPVGSTNLTTEQIKEIRMVNSKGVTVLHVAPTA